MTKKYTQVFSAKCIDFSTMFFSVHHTRTVYNMFAKGHKMQFRMQILD